MKVYLSMAEEVVQEAMRSRRVAVVLYGHPIVGSTISQMIFNRAAAQSVSVQARAAISSLDCLFADIGFDPAIEGALILDASQVSHRKNLFGADISLVLLQIGLTGIYHVPSLTMPLRPVLEPLVLRLTNTYGPEHSVMLYEAPVHILLQPRLKWCRLTDLSAQTMTLATTLFVPSISWLSNRPIDATATSAHRLQTESLLHGEDSLER
jgi:hypothetical protein